MSTILNQPTQNIKGSIISYAFEIKKKGQAESTAQTAMHILTRLSNLADLNKPEEIRTILANANWKNSTKNTRTKIYDKRALCYNRIRKV